MPKTGPGARSRSGVSTAWIVPRSDFELGDRSLALDAQGHAHVVYASDQLLYAWYDGATWQREVVDDAPGHRRPLPVAGLPGVGCGRVRPISATLNTTSTALMHARRTPQGWQIDTVDTLPPGQVFNYDTALAVDRSGNPHIAYPKNGRLYYTAWSGNQWNTQLVDPRQKVEFHVSLALDGTDHPHISYTPWNPTNGASLTYVHWTGNAWSVETVDDGTWVGYYNSIAVDHQGIPHISYLDYTNRQVKHAHRTGGGWQIEAVDVAAWPTGTTSLALDPNDHPHIAYISQTRGLCYAHWTGTTWEIHPVDSNFSYTSLALDTNGQPQVATFQWSDRSLQLAAWQGTGWQRQAVDHTPDVGTHSSDGLLVHARAGDQLLRTRPRRPARRVRSPAWSG